MNEKLEDKLSNWHIAKAHETIYKNYLTELCSPKDEVSSYYLWVWNTEISNQLFTGVRLTEQDGLQMMEKRALKWVKTWRDWTTV